MASLILTIQVGRSEHSGFISSSGACLRLDGWIFPFLLENAPGCASWMLMTFSTDMPGRYQTGPTPIYSQFRLRCDIP